jgi:hypothetical protein
VLVPALPQPDAVPRTIEVSLSFAGRGTVTLGPLAFVKRSAEAIQETASRRRAQWVQDGATSARTTTVLSTVVGALVAVAFIAVSVAGVVLSRAGRAEDTVMIMLVAAMGLGGASAVVGALAWILGQPARGYLALLLPGLIAVAVAGKLYPRIRHNYASQHLGQLTQAMGKRREV